MANSQAPDSGSRGALLEVRGVAKRFGPRDVLKSIFLNIASGEFLTLLGESGSGKTTLLRLIAGFEPPSAGEIWMGGERLDTRNPTSKLMLTILAGVATWEREIMLERQREGIAKAKAAGKYKGRPISIDAAQIRQLRAELGPAAIAKRLGIARSSVYRVLGT